MGEISPGRAFPPLASSKLGFLPALVGVTGDFKDSLVLGCFCSLEVTTEASVGDVLSGVTGDFTSASDVDRLGILDFEPVTLEEAPELWSFKVGNIETVLSLLCSLCDGKSLGLPTFVLSVEVLSFVVTFLVLLPAAEDGLLVPLVVVCQLSDVDLTPRLDGVAWLVPWPFTPDPTACDFGLCMSEVSSKSEASESIFSLTMGSGVFVSECVFSSVVGNVSRLSSLNSTLLFGRLDSLKGERVCVRERVIKTNILE